MRAVLIYNGSAGTAASEDAIVSELRTIGWKVERSVGPHPDVDACVAKKPDVIVVAGGDGTVGKVAKRLAGTPIPLAVIPMGTANNIARSLGVGVDPLVAAASLAHTSRRKLDLGVVRTDRYVEPFIEGFGLGVFARLMTTSHSKGDKALHRSLGRLADEVERFAPLDIEVEVDGKDRSGPCVLAAVMNMRSFGPAIGVAPDAQWDDGELDLALVHPDASRSLVAHLRRAASVGDLALPAFDIVRAKRVRLRVKDTTAWAHIDDTVRPFDGEAILEVRSAALGLLVQALAPAREREVGRDSGAEATREAQGPPTDSRR
jgi:diacylglycerol kinase family enzyme